MKIITCRWGLAKWICGWDYFEWMCIDQDVIRSQDNFAWINQSRKGLGTTCTYQVLLVLECFCFVLF